MVGFQRVGGLAAILAAATYLVGFWAYFTVLGPANYGSSLIPPSQHVEFLVENQPFMHLWNLIIFILNAILMVVISVAVHHRIKHGCEQLAQTATVFGLIWAGLILASGMVANISLEQIVKLAATDPEEAATLWLALTTVEEGIGGGNEITGGMWILLVSWAAQWARSIPSVINLLGLIVGGAGVLTMVPALTEAATVFGLGFIVWFVLVGFVLLFTKART